MLSKMTLKRAKELAKQHIGRLPRAGWEYIIYSDKYYRLTLVNRSGKLELSETLTPFYDYEWDESAKHTDTL